MERATYESYLAAFNARDYDRVLSFWDDGAVEVAFAGYAFRSKQAIRDFYGFFHDYVREEIAIHHYVANDRMIALEATVRLTGIKPLTPSLLAPQGLDGLATPDVGQVIEIPQFIHYHLRDGRFATAVCAVSGPVTATGGA